MKKRNVFTITILCVMTMLTRGGVVTDSVVPPTSNSFTIGTESKPVSEAYIDGVRLSAAAPGLAHLQVGATNNEEVSSSIVNASGRKFTTTRSNDVTRVLAGIPVIRDYMTVSKVNNAAPGTNDTTTTAGRLAAGTVNAGDGRLVINPSVMWDAEYGFYRMWYIGSANAYATSMVFHATSTDGLEWTKYNNAWEETNDVIGTHGRLPAGTGLSGDSTIGSVCVVKDLTAESASRYRMYYTGRTRAATPYRLYMAISSDGLTWYKLGATSVPPASDTLSTYGTVALGTSGKGDDNGIQYPTVLKAAGVYRMWYAGARSGDPFTRIYHATSTNGFLWTKYNNTTPAVNVNTLGRISYGSVGTLDEQGIFGGTAIYRDGRYELFYSGWAYGICHTALATSPDGLTWTKVSTVIPSASNSGGTQGRIPVGGAGRADTTYTLPGSVVFKDNTYRIFYSGCNSALTPTWAILSATSPDGFSSEQAEVIRVEGINASNVYGRITLGATNGQTELAGANITLRGAVDVTGALAVAGREVATLYAVGLAITNNYGTAVKPKIDLLENNVILNAFRIQAESTANYRDMLQGWVDGYVDQTGINTGASVNAYYASRGYKGYVISESQALHVNGLSTYITNSGSLLTWTGDFTLLLWVQADYLADEFLLYGVQNNRLMWGSNHKLELGRPDVAVSESAMSVPNDKEFHLVGMTYNSSTEEVIYYIDGNSAGTANGADIPTPTGVAYIGTPPWEPGQAAFGSIGSVYAVGIWNSILLQSTITGLYEAISFDSASPSHNFVFDGTLDGWAMAAGSETYTNGVSVSAATNLTLISTNYPAASIPTEMDVMIISATNGAPTINTQIRVKVTANNGTNYQDVTLSDAGLFDSTKRFYTGTITNITNPGNRLGYRIETTNAVDVSFYGASIMYK